MTVAYWFTQQEHGGVPVERAALGACDLSVLHVCGEWQWLVRRDGRDIAEGAARRAIDAQRQAEAAALRHAAQSSLPLVTIAEISPVRKTR